jgi:glycosyltransferase involved in cell wall biosynthesis
MNRLLSVVIPSHNGARFIGASIRSVFEQTYRPIELVIVDDGSTDESIEVIRETCREPLVDNLIIVEQSNEGAHTAIMKGLEMSSGEYLSILNCDDFYHPDRFTELIPALRHEWGLAFSGIRFVGEDGSPLPRSHGWPAWYEKALRETDDCPAAGYALLLHNFSVTSGNFLFTKDLYRQLGGFSTHRFVHDWDFLIRSVYYTEPVFERKELMSYRIHQSNTTESVRHLLFDEATDALNRFIALCDAGEPPNRLAPCALHWPRFFPEFIASHSPFFAPGSRLSSFFAR